MRTTALFWFLAVASSAAAQQQQPNASVQREAMKKLAFLEGTWTGEAITQRSNQVIKVRQTEQVAYKLDGLVLLIEGTGRNRPIAGYAWACAATSSWASLICSLPSRIACSAASFRSRETSPSKPPLAAIRNCTIGRWVSSDGRLSGKAASKALSSRRKSSDSDQRGISNGAKRL